MISLSPLSTLPPGKYQRAGIEVDLVMANHHEDFDFPGGGVVAQQQDGRCGTRGDDLGHVLFLWS